VQKVSEIYQAALGGLVRRSRTEGEARMKQEDVGKFFTKNGEDVWRMVWYTDQPQYGMKNLETGEQVHFTSKGLEYGKFKPITMPGQLDKASKKVATKNIGHAIKVFRLYTLEMGLHRFAELLGVSASHLSNVERGKPFDAEIELPTREAMKEAKNDTL
jgi:DNA-binding transcriptional regulator YiaG